MRIRTSVVIISILFVAFSHCRVNAYLQRKCFSSTLTSCTNTKSPYHLRAKLNNQGSILPGKDDKNVLSNGYLQRTTPLMANFSICRQARKIATMFIALASIVLSFSRRATAAAGVKGWDLYGRVPYDDWLFTTGKLVDADLLKRSIIEVVSDEIPDVFANFSRKKNIYNFMLLTKGSISFAVVLIAAALIFTRVRGSIKSARQKSREREADIRGFFTPVSATYKGSGNKGREVKGNPGWIDMSRRGSWGSSWTDEDDEDDDDDDDNDGEGGSDEKGSSRNDDISDDDM
mmetsp:Transcript_1010/g.1675  ORF Transcript_1010/g.1675 Transcript_1010/m.1675 type:complete len:289 (-) Transcript_1010:121-987(-)